MRFIRCAALCAAGLAFAIGPTNAESIREKTQRKEADIPTCARNLGTIAIREPERNWWTELNLASPEVLLKVFVRKSGCFTLVDRGKGFEMAQQERALASGGDLQQGSNIGKGQVKAADYILVPDIASKNADAGGVNIGGILGGFVGHGAGAILGGLNLHSSTADVVLSIVNVRTNEDGPIEQGHGTKTDLGFGVGGGWGTWGGFGGAGVTSYTNTEIGQVVTLAYIDAYTKLVNEMGGMPSAAEGGASAQAPGQAVTMTRPGRMYTTSSPDSKVVRALSAGAMLYPTGNKEGAMWEVKDELGNDGWVSSMSFELAK
ncbi:MAG: peptidoglycan-binding protein [Alphaproteobacteria bacterium]|nr:peptidoglycan-binding protein [Alphaproteobacteria bacterium]MBV9692135.1 peptidoglycan-binding protein [Alphaproteobacteria bacterium]